MTDSNEDWKEYRRLILTTLDRVEKKLDDKEGDFVEFKAEIKSDIKVLKQAMGEKVSNTDFQVMRAKLSFWLAIGMIVMTGLIQGAIKMVFE